MPADGPGRFARALALVGALSMPFAAGCSEEPAPIVAAKRFASAVQSRDTQGILDLVDAQTLSYVQHSAERASDQIGGRRSVDPSEMLQVVDVDARFAVVKAELLSESGGAATVRLVGADGTEHDLQLVYEDEAWKVVLPTPPTPAGTAAPAAVEEPSP